MQGLSKINPCIFYFLVTVSIISDIFVAIVGAESPFNNPVSERLNSELIINARSLSVIALP